MAFGMNKKELVGIETRFQTYENLSNQMLSRLEKAIDRITESNHTIAIILERHENRLDQNSQSNGLLIKMDEEIKDAIDKRMIGMEKKIEDVSTIKSIVIGIGVVSAIVATSLFTLAFGWWTPSEIRYQMERKNVPIEQPK
jgi:hypothetical protein